MSVLLMVDGPFQGKYTQWAYPDPPPIMRFPVRVLPSQEEFEEAELEAILGIESKPVATQIHQCHYTRIGKVENPMYTEGVWIYRWEPLMDAMQAPEQVSNLAWHFDHETKTWGTRFAMTSNAWEGLRQIASGFVKSTESKVT